MTHRHDNGGSLEARGSSRPKKSLRVGVSPGHVIDWIDPTDGRHVQGETPEGGVPNDSFSFLIIFMLC